jgi:uncharacterized repeat protein (TIGR01451 family)
MEGLRLRRWPGLLAVALSCVAASCKEVTVTAEDVASVEVTPASQAVVVGQTVIFRARVLDAQGRELRRSVTWASSSNALATVNSEGQATGVLPGAVNITATAAGKTGQAQLTINPRPVTTVEVSPPSTTLPVGDSARFTATARAADGSIVGGKVPVWTSAPGTIASVRADGMARALAAGTATISATIDGIRGDASLNVRASVQAVTTVRVDPASASVGVGDTLTFIATALASDGSPIAGRPAGWSSSNTAVADIDANGRITAKAAGSTSIRATVDGVVGQATLTVVASTVATVTVDPPSSTLAVGGSITLTAILRAQNGTEIKGPRVLWSTSSALVATVDTAGRVTARGVGNATITATADGKSGTAQIFVVTQPVSSVDITPVSPALFVGDTVILTAVLRDANGTLLTNRTVTWISSDTTVAVVVSAGPVSQQARLIGRRAGTVSISAMAESRTGQASARVDPRADLVVTKTTPAALVKAGDTVSFTLQVRNAGPSAAAAVVITDTLPGNAVFVSATGGATQSGNVLTWPAVASLAVNAAQSFTIRIVAPGSGGFANIGAAVTSTFDRNLANNRAVSAVSVSPADLLVKKSASAGTVSAGDTIVYTIDVSNNGSSLAASVTVTDTLPANAVFVDATGSPTHSGNLLTWPVLPTLNVGASVSFTVRVVAPLTGGSVVNVAAALSASGDANLADNRAAVSVSVNALANLVVSKFASPSVVGPNDTITYSVRVRNAGPSPATAVITRDTLPGNASYVQGSAGGATLSGNVLTWPTLASLAAGDSVTFNLRVIAGSGGTITNVAAATSSTTDPDPSSNRATVSTSIALADLEVTKSGPASVNAADTVTYTIGVSNGGPNDASGVIVRDTLPAGVTFLSATGGGTLSGNAVIWSLGTLANGGSTSLTLKVLAPAAGATLNNVARVNAATRDPDASNNRSTASTTVIPVANLGVAKGGTPSVNPGDTITWIISVANAGPSAAASVTVSDTLPAGVTFVSAAGGGGGTESGGVVTWGPGTLTAGSFVVLTLRAVAPATGGVITNVVRVSSATADPSTGNNRAAANTTVTVANLGIAKSGSATITVADTLNYTITVSNAGPTVASSLVVTDTLPAGVNYLSSVPAAAVSGNVLTWNLASLASGANTQFTVRALPPAGGGSVTNAAAVTSPTSDPSLANNHATFASTVNPAANLSISKTGPTSPAQAGDTVTFSITVSNAGPSAASAVVVTDSLPTNGSFVSATGPGGPATPSGNLIVFAPVASIAAGGSETYTVRWEVPSSTGVTNYARVTAATTDPNPGNNASSASVTVMAADLDVSVTAPASVAGGDKYTYTINVTNNGPGRALGVTVTSPVPSNATLLGTTPPASGTTTLTWTESRLNAGDSRSYEVELQAPPAGDVIVSATASAPNDGNPSNNTRSDTTTVVPLAADVAIAVTTTDTLVAAGDTITYSVEITNTGSNTALGVAVQSTVSNATFVVGGSGTTAATTVALLLPGGSTTWTLRAVAGATGTVVNTATITGSLTTDPNTSNNTSTVSTTVN